MRLRSLPADASIEVSVWLKQHVVMVSTDVGQWSVCVGLEDEGRFRSYNDMTLDEAANVEDVLCMEREVKAPCPSQVAVGALRVFCALYGSKSFIVLSAAAVRSRLSCVHVSPFTILLCADALKTSSRDPVSQTLTVPSPAPEASLSRDLGSPHNEYTPSSCP